jgi:O-antigen/teichoic acid export membrane protein
MIHPLLVKIKNLLQENKYIELKKNVNILLLIYFIFGILFVGICYFIGMPILHLLYGIDLSKYNSSFMLIIIGAIFYGATIMISYILIAMRKTLSQFIILVISSILALISSHILVSRYGIIGSGVNLLFIMFIEFIFYEILLITSIRGEMKK